MARPRSNIQPRIIRAARKHFLHDGVDGASLRTIARGARTSIGMVYYYFPTKDDLFLAVIEEVYGDLLSGFTAALASGVPFEERLRRLFVRIGALSEVEFAVVQLVVREALVSSARRQKLLGRFLDGHIPLVLGALLDGMREGRVDARYPPALLVLLTMAVGAVPQIVGRLAGEHFPGPGLPTGEALASELVKLLLSGIGKAVPTA